MSAAVQDHSAGRATQLLVAATKVVSDPVVAELLSDAAVEVAATYQSYDAVLANNARLLALNIHLERDLRGLRDQGIVDAREITDLKTRLGRAAEENEAIYIETDHEVGHATKRHLAVMRVRALLDLSTPLPPRKAVAMSTPTPYGAPRTAAGAH